MFTAESGELPLQGTHVSDHRIHGFEWEKMPEPGFLDPNRIHRSGALGDDFFQLRIRFALHVCLAEPGNLGFEETVCSFFTPAILTMTSATRLIESRLSRQALPPE